MFFFVLFTLLYGKTNHRLHQSRDFQISQSCLMTARVLPLMMHGISPAPAHAATAYSAKQMTMLLAVTKIATNVTLTVMQTLTTENAWDMNKTNQYNQSKSIHNQQKCKLWQTSDWKCNFSSKKFFNRSPTKTIIWTMNWLNLCETHDITRYANTAAIYSFWIISDVHYSGTSRWNKRECNF